MPTLFRPSFCAHCGEKIERSDWGILTSRRFCDVCATENIGHEMFPRIVVGMGVLAGIFGFGSYLKSGSGDEMRALRQPRPVIDQSAPGRQLTAANAVKPPAGNLAMPANQATGQMLSAAKPASKPPLVKPQVAVDEPIYYCGAATKKGTPCSRRVKGNSRCFQHTGLPSMPSSKN